MSNTPEQKQNKKTMSAEEKHYETIHELIEHNQEQADKHRIVYSKEMYNLVVDACIAKVKSLDTWEPSEDYIFSKIISELEQLKKPIPKNI